MLLSLARVTNSRVIRRCILIASLSWQFLAVADETDDYVREQMTQRQIPAVVVKVLRDGKDVKTAAYGLANLEHHVPATTNSVFEIGSVTKQFTATCILLLQQEGRLSIEDRISRHLPNAPVTWSNVTIRHLLSHTSGIKSYTGLDGFALTKHLTQAQFIELIGRQPMEFAPGDNWKYSNTGYNLLGHIIENVSGESYWQFLRRRILAPLGMTQTTDRNPANLITNRAAGYERTNRLHINRDYDVTDVFAAGAMVSTVGDLARWSIALDGDVLLSTASKELAWSPQRLTNGKATKYGLGWYVEPLEGHRCIGHGGSTSGFSASIQKFRDETLCVILLTNSDESIATTLARRVAGFYFGRGK